MATLENTTESAPQKSNPKPEPLHPPQTRIYLVGGRKGGVGKTFISRHLAEYLTVNQQPFSLIEADVTIGDVGGVYGGLKEGKKTAAIELSLSDDPKKYNQPDVIFAKALEKQNVLVNLPAETNDALSRWMTEVNLMDLCQQGNVQLFLWFVTDGCYASMRLLSESLKLLDGKIPHIVIRNEGRLNGVDFEYLDKEPIYEEIASAPNCLCIRDFPVLGSAEQFYLDKHGLTYAAGIELSKEDLGLIGAQRIKTFAECSYKVLDEIFVEVIAKYQNDESTKSTGADTTKSSEGSTTQNFNKPLEKGNMPISSDETDSKTAAPESSKPSADAKPGQKEKK